MKRNRLFLVALVLVMAGSAQRSRAELLFPTPSPGDFLGPIIAYDGVGCITITPDPDGISGSTFELTAEPTGILIDGSFFLITEGTDVARTLTMKFHVDRDGNLDDSFVEFLLTGEVMIGTSPYSGNLLEGMITGFGVAPSATNTSVFDMQFVLVGGALQFLFNDVPTDLYLLVTISEQKVNDPPDGNPVTCDSTGSDTSNPFDGSLFDSNGDPRHPFDFPFLGTAKGFITGTPGTGGGNGEPPAGGGEGCTPGYWKQPQHEASWVGFSPGDDFGVTFGTECGGALSGTLLEALQRGGGKAKALGRHAVAALLNASSGDVSYAFTVAEVIAEVQMACSGDKDAIEAAKNAFVLENEAGCPLN